jgi:hypothetical protein
VAGLIIATSDGNNSKAAAANDLNLLTYIEARCIGSRSFSLFKSFLVF